MRGRFLLFGPNAWTRHRIDQTVSPRAYREEIRRILRSQGHHAQLLELLPNHPDGITEKLERELTSSDWDYVFVYVPAQADTGSINAELYAMRALFPKLQKPPEVWLWPQAGLIEESNGRLQIHDEPIKSAYLRDLMKRVKVRMHTWDRHEVMLEDLREQAEALKDLD